jgi:hypothetical protein
MKYIKTWMGVTSGSHLGRDDGYPERKFALIESIDKLVETYDKKAEYYKLEPVDVSAAVQAIKDLS